MAGESRRVTRAKRETLSGGRAPRVWRKCRSCLAPPFRVWGRRQQLAASARPRRAPHRPTRSRRVGARAPRSSTSTCSSSIRAPMDLARADRARRAHPCPRASSRAHRASAPPATPRRPHLRVSCRRPPSALLFLREVGSIDLEIERLRRTHRKYLQPHVEHTHRELVLGHVDVEVEVVDRALLLLASQELLDWIAHLR